MFSRCSSAGKVILATVLLASSPAAVLSADAMDRYTSSELGIAFDYPSGWAKDEEPGVSVAFSSDANFRDAGTDTGAGFALMVVPSEYTGDPELEVIWEALVPDMGLQVEEPRFVTVGGVKGLGGRINAGEKDMAMEIYLLQAGQKVYLVLTVIHPASELENTYRPVLREMLDTLEFVP